MAINRPIWSPGPVRPDLEKFRHFGKKSKNSTYEHTTVCCQTIQIFLTKQQNSSHLVKKVIIFSGRLENGLRLVEVNGSKRFHGISWKYFFKENIPPTQKYRNIGIQKNIEIQFYRNIGDSVSDRRHIYDDQSVLKLVSLSI